MHLAASNLGACAYLLEGAEDSNEGVHLSTIRDPQVDSEDRTQARHPPAGEAASWGVHSHPLDETPEHRPRLGTAGEVHPSEPHGAQSPGVDSAGDG